MKSLKRKIEKKLDQLQELLDSIEEARLISADDPDTWDSDALYNLVEQLKAALALLEDQESKLEKDEFGSPLVLEEGLCSLVDKYTSEAEEEEDDY